MSMPAPDLAALDAATEHTADVNADPGASLYDRCWAAEQEAALYDQFPAEPYGDPGLEGHEAGIEEPEAG